MIIQSRRNFIIGLTSVLAAPTIVRADSLMKVKAIRDCGFGYSSIDILYPLITIRPEWHEQLKQTIIAQYCYMDDGSIVVRTHK